MSPILDIRPFSPSDSRFQAILARGAAMDTEVGPAAAAIVAAVRDRGSAALIDFVQRFDSPAVTLENLAVTPAEIASACASVEPDFLSAVSAAAGNIRAFHAPQIRAGYSLDAGSGARLAKIVLPIHRVGVYCPAGTAPLFSSLLMNVIPAQLAGVAEIAVAIPPRRDGTLSPYMLAAAHHLGLTEIYKMGGAHAVAAFAYGASPVRRVDKIVGPGNAYVAAAKRLVFGTVGLDAVAGPSEIVVIADSGAKPAFVAADLLSQAEHGSGHEAAVLLTDDEGLARRVAAKVENMLPGLARSPAARAALARYGAAFVCSSLDEALDAANAIAPEHLEIQTADPRRLLPGVVNAGAVFLGAWSPEPIGDYFAGTNHVLPTNGAARFSSSLGVADFQKDISVIEYSREKLAAAGRTVTLMAEREGLAGHAGAVQVRLREIAGD